MNLTPADIRFLCTALGFTAVTMQGEMRGGKEGAQQVAAFAGLIEEYCRATLADMPEAGAASQS